MCVFACLLDLDGTWQESSALPAPGMNTVSIHGLPTLPLCNSVGTKIMNQQIHRFKAVAQKGCFCDAGYLNIAPAMFEIKHRSVQVQASVVSKCILLTEYEADRQIGMTSVNMSESPGANLCELVN